MIDIDEYEGLTIDDWYKMNHHDWKDVVNEHNDLLVEVKRLQTIMHEIEHNNGVTAEVVAASGDALFINELLAEVKRLGQENKKIEGFLFDSHATRKKAMSLAIILDEQLIRAAEWARAKVNGDQEKVDAFWDYIEEE